MITSAMTQRATSHPLYVQSVAEEFARLLPVRGASAALRLAEVEAVETWADADPADLLLSDDEWEAKNQAAMNGG